MRGAGGSDSRHRCRHRRTRRRAHASRLGGGGRDPRAPADAAGRGHRDLPARQRRTCPRHVGLGAQVAERAVHIRRQRTADHRGRVLFDVDVDELWNGVGPCLALPRTDLHRVLLGGIDDVPIRWGQTPALIAPDGTGVVVETAEGHTDVRLVRRQRRWQNSPDQPTATTAAVEADPPPELNRAAPGAKNYADNEVDGSRSARTRQRNGQVHR